VGEAQEGSQGRITGRDVKLKIRPVTPSREPAYFNIISHTQISEDMLIPHAAACGQIPSPKPHQAKAAQKVKTPASIADQARP